MADISLRSQSDEVLNQALGMRAMVENPNFLSRHTQAGSIDRYRTRIEIMDAAAKTLAQLAEQQTQGNQ